MALSTTAVLEINIDFTRERSGFGVASTFNQPRLQISSSWADGAGSGALTALWHKTYSMTGAGTQLVDLQGALSGLVGEAGLSFDNIKGVYWHNKGGLASGHTLAIKGPAGSAWTSFISGAIRLPRGAYSFTYTPDATAWDVSGTNRVMSLVGLDDGTVASFDIDVIIFGNSI